MKNIPHRRYNALTGEWVLVSPHRAKRPWLGQVEKLPAETLPTYDPTCYLCPRNERAGGITNPDYTNTYIFENDFAALLPTLEDEKPASTSPLLVSAPEQGQCFVVCFSPRHDLTLPELELPAIENVLQTWKQASTDLARKDFIQYVQVFENKGAVMGCSNPHPHSQIWAQSQPPNEIIKEIKTQKEYYAQNNRPLLLDYIKEEHKQKERVLFANEHFTAVVPFWAVWPFEVLISAHRATSSFNDLTSSEISALAEIFKHITTKYDNLFETSFPYSMGFHQAPADNTPHPEWVFHAHFYPPLLRSATVKKFMVGFEMLAMPQRDITPEFAAERLRNVSDVHYKNK
jgi:UDPglucose--hexose-1-phosphate uridylyltransferase